MASRRNTIATQRKNSNEQEIKTFCSICTHLSNNGSNEILTVSEKQLFYRIKKNYDNLFFIFSSSWIHITHSSDHLNAANRCHTELDDSIETKYICSVNQTRCGQKNLCLHYRRRQRAYNRCEVV